MRTVVGETREKANRLFRATCVLGGVLVAITCADHSSTAPGSGGQLTPGHARLSIAPRFSPLPEGAPTVKLATVTGVLIAGNGDRIAVTAYFRGDSAVLQFDVQFSGTAADFTLDLSAFDINGVIAYHAEQRITLKPGTNSDLAAPVLVYAAPDAAVTSIKVAPSPLILTAGTSAGVTATGANANGQVVTPLRVGWVSRNGAVASVDDNGMVRAGSSQGATYVVGRTASNAADSAQVKVRAPVAKVVVSPAAVVVARGQSASASAELRDEANNLIDDRTAVWSSSDPTIATVSAGGSITGVKVGTATVTAAAEGKLATVPVTVVSPLDHVELTPATLSVASFQQTFALTTKLVPRPGAAVDAIVPAYASDKPDVVAVSSAGVVTSLKNGSATITVSADGSTASTVVTVKQVAASGTVAPKSASVSVIGEARTFAATAMDAQGNQIAGAVFAWSSSDPTVATVSGGTATGRKAGTASITATSDGKTDAATFNVSPTTSVLLAFSNKSSIAVGATAIVSAKYGDAGGTPLGDAPAAFSTTTPGIVSVSGAVVTGLSAGKGHIVATAGTLSASVDVTVTSGGGGGGGGGGATLVITPSTVEKLPGGTQTFAVSSGGEGPFSWTVNGIPAPGALAFGHLDLGEVSSVAYYTAPASVPTPATFDICAAQASPAATGCAHVTVSTVPSSGADLVVINDMNLMEDEYITAGNQALFKNIVAFTPVGARASATQVMFHFGHASACAAEECGPEQTTLMRSSMLSGGVTAFIDDYSGTLGPIPAGVKVLFLMTPQSGFGATDVNLLKSFASQGGRIVFIGENPNYYEIGIPVENQLLLDLGGQLANSSNSALCTVTYTIGAGHINPHQITAGVPNLSVPCATEILLGPNDYAIAYGGRDADGVFVPVIAVAKIDVTPLFSGGSARRPRVPAQAPELARAMARASANAARAAANGTSDKTGLGPMIPKGPKSP